MEAKGAKIRRSLRSLPAWLAVLAAFVTVALQHGDSRELVRVQITLELIKLFESAEMRHARRVLANELQDEKGRGDISDTTVLDFFETLAMYSDQGHIDDDTIYINFSYCATRYWTASEEYVKALRRRENDKGLYEGFEKLNARFIAHDARERRKPIRSVKPTDDQVQQFLRDESRPEPKVTR
jgi:Domain of unknown function (DUF4760)